MKFATLTHADWSNTPKKRWAAVATSEDGGWYVELPAQVSASPRFLDLLFERTSRGAVLAGFDFPIGLPLSYGSAIGAADFRAALNEFGTGRWSRFYDVAETAAEICIERPFYPRQYLSQSKQSHLLNALGVGSINELRRQCERHSGSRRAACPLFWTLGGNQVGKAAIAGWKEIISPACQRGAKLWPFDGSLEDLAADGGLIIVETYPAEAYGHIGIHFSQGESKRRRDDRAAKAGSIISWAERSRVTLGWARVTSPAERPTKFELVLNLRAAKRLGIEIPTSVLLRADEVIE